MAHKDKIYNFLIHNKQLYCDDCLSALCDINPRQAIFQICTKLKNDSMINRNKGICYNCNKEKMVSSIGALDDSREEDIKIRKNVKMMEEPAIKNHFEKANEGTFIPIKLVYSSFNIDNSFSKYNSHTLRVILDKEKYYKLNPLCERNYKNYFDISLGEFLLLLKQQNNLLYKKFLNPYGDFLFCRFRMQDNDLLKCKGLYMYKINNEIKYIGRVKGDYDFNRRINWGYANISPKNCYIDGQATNCHINALINKILGQIDFYVMPLEDDEQICDVERKLIKQHQPEWNIALK